MNKNPRLWHVLILAIILFGFTYTGVTAGWFRGMYYIDMPLHFFAGTIIGIFFWWIISLFNLKVGEKFGALMSFIGFSTLVSFAWESYEYMNWKYFAQVTPAYEFFSPTVSDLLSDLLLTFLGATIISIIYIILKRRREKLDTIAS